MTIRIECAPLVDELGEQVEFTSDLAPLVPLAKTAHLDENGLPSVGTQIMPGMVIVGRIGKTRQYDKTKAPDCLEYLNLSDDELRIKYGNMWKDYSIYAESVHRGKVISSQLVNTSNGCKAIVEIA